MGKVTITTFDVLKLLVNTLEQAEKVASFKDLPGDYRLDALEIGKKQIKAWEKSLNSIED